MSAADYEGTAHRPFLPKVQASRFNIIARFPDPVSAARAVERVRASGVPEADVSVLGAVADAVDPGTGLTEPDARVVRSAWNRAWLFGIVGGVIGAIIGIILILIPGFRHAVHAQLDWPAFIAAILIGGIVGAVGNALVGGVAGLDRSAANVDPYLDQLATGPELVGVHTTDAHETEIAAAALREAGATAIDSMPPTTS
jgi:hypothetical protein